MAYNRPPTDSSELTEFQTEIVASGNIALDDNALTVRSFTDGIYSIDLLELSYLPFGESTTNSSWPTIAWANQDHSNDSGTDRRSLTLSATAAGIYFMEYNVPVNLYKFNGAKHRFGSQQFRLLLLKADGSRMNTAGARMRLRIRYYKPNTMNYDASRMPTVLNAPT